MTTELYRIVFSGQVTRGSDAAGVRRNLAALFRVDAESVELLFSGRPVILKEGIKAEEAVHYLSILSQAGAVARMEPSPPGAAKSNRAKFMDRREIQRRASPERRKRPRHDSLMPDRRHIKSRRSTES